MSCCDRNASAILPGWEARTFSRREWQMFSKVIVWFVACTPLFSAASAADFLVTNTDDDGPGSLRQAVADANDADGRDAILFDGSLAGQEIVLASTLEIDSNLEIDGRGANNLILRGSSGGSDV